MKYTIGILVATLVFNLTGIAQSNQQPEQPNILWITSEDNSKHYLKLFDKNGVETPNIEALAKEGVVFDRAFSNTPVCSAARSTLISGCYGPRAASHYHRHIQKVPMPEGVEMYPAYLHQAGYYTTNNSKEDYNFFKSDSVWDESSNEATWRKRAEDQPFFHIQNILTTHESRLHFTQEDYANHITTTNPKDCFVQPNHPNTDLLKYTNAYYRDKVVQMDKEVGEILDELKKDGLMDETIVFYYSDHGGVLPGSKGYIYETGLHIPLVVYVPEKYQHLVNLKPGTRTNGFVSFVDFGATLLNLAGIPIPEGIDGKPFLGKNISTEELNQRDETFSYTNRMDEKYDMVRAYRKGKYKYMRNFNPMNFDGLMNNYRYKQLAYQEWLELNDKRELNRVQSQFFNAKPLEALYDIEADPYETRNLANNPDMQEKLKEMRGLLFGKMVAINDLSVYPEFFLIKSGALDNPVAFGVEHSDEIKQLLEVANLPLNDYDDVKEDIQQYLESDNSWVRYWALIACASFGKEAADMTSVINDIAQNDAELINQVRAAEFLAIGTNQSPVEIMTRALYSSEDPVEALLIINSIVVMQDGFGKYGFSIEAEKLSKVAQENQMVKWRMSYL